MTTVFIHVADLIRWCNEVAGTERRERLENIRDTLLEALETAETWKRDFWQAVANDARVTLNDPL